MKNNLKFRHELKYFISEPEKEVIARRLSTVMQRDAHVKDGRYFIRSLYFDDQFENAYEEKLAGTNERKKYRIRIYNLEDSVIRLECKRKEGQYINKISAKLTREETDKLLRGEYNFLKDRQEQVCKDFYLECALNQMKPKVIVDYDREPYVYSFGDVRITFDEHVRSGVFEQELFDQALPVMEVLEPGQLIMEVKFTEYLPEIIRDLLQVDNCIYTAASKYVLCLEKRKEYIGD